MKNHAATILIHLAAKVVVTNANDDYQLPPEIHIHKRASQLEEGISQRLIHNFSDFLFSFCFNRRAYKSQQTITAPNI